MNLVFENIVVKNFRTFIGSHKFAFAEYGPGLSFMKGRNKLEPSLGANDAGKTTLWNALHYCLFGTGIDGLRAPDLLPWGAPDAQLSVRTSFSADGVEHTLERSHSPNGLTLDGKTCGQEQINRTLQMSPALFSNTILMGQGQPLFFDLAPREALALFGEGLNLNRWDVRSAFAKDECDRLERKLAKYEGELDATKNAREDAEANMGRAKRQADEWSEGNKTVIKSLRDKLAYADEQLIKQRDLKDAADLAYDGAGTELKAIQQEINQLKNQYDIVRGNKIKEQVTLEVMGKKAHDLETELKSLGRGNLCPTCNQKITGTSLDKHKKELRAKIEELHVACEKGIPKSILKELETFERTLRKSREDEIKFKSKADDAFSSMNRLTGVVATWEADIRALHQRIEDNEQAKNVYHSQYIQFKKDVQILDANIADIERDIAKTRRLIDRTRPWIKGFKEIRLLVVDRVLEELEFVTNTILLDLGLENWKTQYAIDRETKSGSLQRGLNVSILSPRNKKPVKWKCWGGGVGQRLRIAGALAFAEVLLNHANVMCNLEILDEPTRHMTRNGARDLCNYLASRAIKQKKTIWLIDHLSIDSDKFDDVVTVVKDNNGSHIVWD